MFPPKKIINAADKNELELQGTKPVTKSQKEVAYTYRYIASETKKGTEIDFPETELKILLSRNVFTADDGTGI